MGIGVSILLIAVGLILAIATSFSLPGLNIQLIGWILVGAGVAGLIITMVVWGPRRRTVSEEYVVEEERPTTDEQPPTA